MQTFVETAHFSKLVRDHLSDDEYLGQLDDILAVNAGVRPGVHLSPFIYTLKRNVKIVPNYEVEDVIWVPLQNFVQSGFALSMAHPREPGYLVSGVRVGPEGNHVMWGLSYRVMQSLFEVADVPIRNWRVRRDKETRE
jgi:hypothetical protein